MADEDVDSHVGAGGGEHYGSGAGMGRLSEELFHHLAPQADHRFGGCPVAMDGHISAGFDGVEHALGVILGVVAEVEVAAQAGRGFGLGGQGV